MVMVANNIPKYSGSAEIFKTNK